MLTDAQIAQMRAMLDALTPGPYVSDEYGAVYSYSKTWRYAGSEEEHPLAVVQGNMHDGGFIYEPDQAFFCAAPTFLRQLLDEREALLEANAQMQWLLEDKAR